MVDYEKEPPVVVFHAIQETAVVEPGRGQEGMCCLPLQEVVYSARISFTFRHCAFRIC